MMRFSARLAALCALGSVSALGVSVGGGAAAEPFPSGIRIITETDATSDCIGDISTPVCALDTLEAAFARADSDLHRLVSSPGQYKKPSEGAEPSKVLPSRYRFKKFCYSTSEYNFYNYLEPSGSGVFKLRLYVAVESITLGEIYHTYLVNETRGWQVNEATIMGWDEEDCETEPPPEWRPVVFE